MAALEIVALCDDSGRIVRTDLADALCLLHRQLRPMLPDNGAAYLAKMQRVCHYGARLVAALDDEGRPLGMALYRMYENTYEDLRLYVDDLVSDEAARSQGVGSQLLAWCEAQARAAGCRFIVLDSGTWRTQAHKLYFRLGFSITSFHFTKPL